MEHEIRQYAAAVAFERDIVLEGSRMTIIYRTNRFYKLLLPVTLHDL